MFDHDATTAVGLCPTCETSSNFGPIWGCCQSARTGARCWDQRRAWPPRNFRHRSVVPGFASWFGGEGSSTIPVEGWKGSEESHDLYRNHTCSIQTTGGMISSQCPRSRQVVVPLSNNQSEAVLSIEHIVNHGRKKPAGNGSRTPKSRTSDPFMNAGLFEAHFLADRFRACPSNPQHFKRLWLALGQWGCVSEGAFQRSSGPLRGIRMLEA